MKTLNHSYIKTQHEVQVDRLWCRLHLLIILAFLVWAAFIGAVAYKAANEMPEGYIYKTLHV